MSLDFKPTSSNLAEIFRLAHRRLKPRTPIPVIHADFFPFAGLNHTARLSDGTLRIRVSDIFMDAPEDVIGSLASILIARLYRKAIDPSVHHHYRKYTLRTDVQERARTARTARGRPPHNGTAHGRHIDLNASYERVRRMYFQDEIQEPTISWSKKRSRYILGRYDALHHAIYVSLLFDSPDVPEYVIDYIMFHELLHVRHRSQVQDARCIVHSADFRADERKFAHYDSAKQWLKSI
jgi:hypothetical protein